MSIKCIIVEDEPLAMERAVAYVDRIPWLQLLATFDKGEDALSYLRSDHAALIFLDINIGKINGIQLLETIGTNAQVIFTTAYQEYALKGYDLNITDYLLKPYTFERFTQAVEKARKNIEASPAQDYIFIKSGNHQERIHFDEILYIEGMGDYRCIYCTEKRVMTLATFYELEKLLPKHIACRVHKSFMVSLRKIDAVAKDQVKVRDKYIPVSETYKSVLKELLDR